MKCRVVIGDANTNAEVTQSDLEYVDDFTFQELKDGYIFCYEYDVPMRSRAPSKLTRNQIRTIEAFGKATLFGNDWSADGTCSIYQVWNTKQKKWWTIR